MSVDKVLEQDLQWREAELASLKRLAINAPAGEVVHRSLLRAMWALLYAHYEGFTKFCWDTILDQVQSAGVPTKGLDEKFSLLALEQKFREHRSNLNSNAIWSFFETELPEALVAVAQFPDTSRPKTESNLWPNIFERESDRLGIKCDELDKHRTRIKALVARRNDIAHGKNMVISDLGEYHEYENATLCLMHELAIKAMEIIEAGKFKKPVHPLIK